MQPKTPAADAQALRRQEAVELLTPVMQEVVKPLLETYTVGAFTGRLRRGDAGRANAATCACSATMIRKP